MLHVLVKLVPRPRTQAWLLALVAQLVVVLLVPLDLRGQMEEVHHATHHDSF